MGESRVLSSEEVDEILKVTQQEGNDLSSLLGDHSSSEDQTKKNSQLLTNIAETISFASEKELSAFFRKKIIIKSNSLSQIKLSDCIKGEEKYIYSLFKIMPQAYHSLIAINLPLLHHGINLLYGGQISDQDEVIRNEGKVGVIIAEKVNQICLSCFTNACKEYGQINCEVIKTTTTTNFSPHLHSNDKFYLLEFSVFFDQLETKLQFILSEAFLNDFIPLHQSGNNPQEKNFWEMNIKAQMIDSAVTVNVALPEISMKVKDFMSLKVGDTIPIGDPTMVYVCLNNLKLFRATAGQVDSKRMAKIISQVK